MYFFLAVLGLFLCRLFSSCGKWDYFLVVVHGLPIVVVSLVAEHWLNSTQASVGVSLGLQSKGSGVVAHGWVAVQHVEPSWTGLEPMSSALAGGFLTTEPPSKPGIDF